MTLRYPDTFPITLLDDNDVPISALGQIDGVMVFRGEPNPSRNLEGEGNQQFMDNIARLLGERHLRIVGKKMSMMPTLEGRWLVAQGSDRRVKITSQGMITSHS